MLHAGKTLIFEVQKYIMTGTYVSCSYRNPEHGQICKIKFLVEHFLNAAECGNFTCA